MGNFNKVWGWGLSGLVLKEWAISFNPTRDVMAPTKVWEGLLNEIELVWGSFTRQQRVDY